MACSACGSRAGKSSVPTVSSRAGGRTLYQVVLKGGDGPVAFQTNNVDLARKVAGNYPGSVLQPDPDAPASATINVTDEVVISDGKKVARKTADTAAKDTSQDA